MRVTIFAALALLLATVSVPAISQTSNPTYASGTDGYSINFPPDWKTKSDPIVNLVAAPEKVWQQASPMPNIKVVVRPMRTGVTLDQLCDISKKQWAGAWTVESDTRVEGSPARLQTASAGGATHNRRLVLVQDLKVLKTKVLKNFSEANGNYYIVSCSDTPENFANSEPMFNEILNSLTYSKPAD